MSEVTEPYWRCSNGPELSEGITEDVRLAFVVAWQYTLGGESVEDIVRSTGKSRATVYRALEQAEDLGILDRSPRIALPRGLAAEALYDDVVINPLARELREAYPPGPGPHEFIVVRAVRSTSGTQKDPGLETSRRIGLAAARRLMYGIIHQGVRVIGISWGTHARFLSNSLPAGVSQRLPHEEAQSIEVFGLHGSIGASGADDALQSGNANAQRIVDRLNSFGVEPSTSDEPPIPSAQVVTQPLLISPRIEKLSGGDGLATLWEFMSADESVQCVFGRAWARERAGAEPAEADPADDKPLLRRSHALITGIGVPDESLRLYRLKQISKQELDAVVKAGAVADVGGHFLYADPAQAKEGDAIQAFNRRVVAPRPVDLSEATQRARNTGRGIGMMMMARYPRARAVLAAIRAGFVNVLVCDDVLAEELLRLAEQAKSE